MRKLKVFAMGTPWGGSRAIATTSKKAAADAMGCSLYSFNEYGGETSHRATIEATLANPGKLLIWRDRHSNQWEFCEKFDIGRPRARDGSAKRLDP